MTNTQQTAMWTSERAATELLLLLNMAVSIFHLQALIVLLLHITVSQFICPFICTRFHVNLTIIKSYLSQLAHFFKRCLDKATMFVI